MEHSKFTRQFAKSLDVDPGPLAACSEALAKQVLRPGDLDPLRLLSTFQKARNGC